MDEHQTNNRGQEKSLFQYAFFVLIPLILAEIFGAILSRSLALLSDAGHMLVDFFAVGLSLFAFRISRFPADRNRTYGYYRAEIIAAFLNGIVLVLVALYIFYEAYHRLTNPRLINVSLMLFVSLVGLGGNLIGIGIMSRGKSKLNRLQTNLNFRSAFLHIISDTLSSFGVILGGILVWLTGWYGYDPVVSIFIGLLILRGAIKLVADATSVLLESVPQHIDLKSLITEVKGILGVKDFHDVHIWTISSGVYALSGHLLLDDQMVSEGSSIRHNIDRLLADKYGVLHRTLQLECNECEQARECGLEGLIYAHRSQEDEK